MLSVANVSESLPYTAQSSRRHVLLLYRNVIQRVGRLPILLLLIWLTVLYWGEYLVFERSGRACSWKTWETWSPGADPHHVLLVADPQLVDPHTYPGRPWPLSSLTIWITDLYMRRTYNALLTHLQPDTTMFLGDLFDGGREWATQEYKSPDETLQSYGASFWINEYYRFMDMFVDSWHGHGLGQLPGNEGRRIITSVAGNHDLGFAGGIHPAVRARFDAYFGPLNRVDVIGNHTFVTVDTVSLSAMDQADPETGSSGSSEEMKSPTKNMQIWKPVEDFLKQVKGVKAEAVTRRYRQLAKFSTTEHEAVEEVSPSIFPTILMTHVPLYRGPDVTCGPQREHGSTIRYDGGYQYQNTLTPLISSDIIEHLDAEQIAMIYSGDDHDYCEINHSEFTGRVPEITVKSISMAMGVSRPGAQLVSLWNPITTNSEIRRTKISSSTPKDTIQNHLCLFPSQIGIFLQYAKMLALTILLLSARALRYKPGAIDPCGGSSGKDRHILPLSQPHQALSSEDIAHHSTSQIGNNTTVARARTNVKLSGYGNLPSSSRSSSPHNLELSKNEKFSPGSQENLVTAATNTYKPPKSYSHLPKTGNNTQSMSFLLTLLHKPIKFLPRPQATRRGEFMRSFLLVTLPALTFYFVLLWDEHRRHSRIIEH